MAPTLLITWWRSKLKLRGRMLLRPGRFTEVDEAGISETFFCYFFAWAIYRFDEVLYVS